MPKKLSINSKSLESRERKAASKKEANEKAVRAAEDRLWIDDDKNLAKKKAKKEEEERKKADALRKKQEARELLEKELASIKPASKPSIQKITQAEVRAEIEKRNKVIETLNAPPKTESRVVVDELPLEENLNRLMGEVSVASTVDEAIAVLNIKDDDSDKHPEKRMKAAFKAFEAANLPRIKAENPSLRLSQWKQLLQREWAKSPENPMNNKA